MRWLSFKTPAQLMCLQISLVLLLAQYSRFREGFQTLNPKHFLILDRELVQPFGK